MSHHASDASEPWDYDWNAGIEALTLAVSESVKDDARFQRYIQECEIAEEKKGAPLEIEEMKSKNDLEHELGVECICQDCRARLQKKGAVDKEFKNADVKETKFENKEANMKVGEGRRGGFNTVTGTIVIQTSRLRMVQTKKTSPSRPQAQSKSRLEADVLHAIERTKILLNAARISPEMVPEETLAYIFMLPSLIVAILRAWTDDLDHLTPMDRNLTTLRDEFWILDGSLKNLPEVEIKAVDYMSTREQT